MAESTILDKLPIPKPEIYFEASKNKYWKQDSEKKWIPLFKDDVIMSLDQLGYSARKQTGQTYSRAALELGRIREEDNIVYAGPVAGNPPGLQESGPHKYLVTRGADLMDPKPGTWDTIRTLGERLFPDGQFNYVLGWSQNAVKGLYSSVCKPGQLLVLAGPPGCGKSFWQHRIITPMLGGRAARPLQYMTGQTSFNEDVIQCEHLLLEDENSKIDIKGRREFGASIKNFTVNVTQRVHGKGRDAFVVNSSHWMSLSVNDEPENLNILPPLDDSLRDKIGVVHCGEAINMEWPGYADPRELEPIVEAELPAFIHYLLNQHKIAEEDSDLRFGIKAYHNPEILARIEELAPETELEALIDAAFPQLAMEKKALRMTQSEIQNALENNPEIMYRARKLLYFSSATGVYLERLSKKNCKKFVKPRSTDRPRIWTISWA